MFGPYMKKKHKRALSLNGYNITHRNLLGLFRLSAVALFRSLSAVARCLQGATGSTSEGAEVDASLAGGWIGLEDPTAAVSHQRKVSVQDRGCSGHGHGQ